MKTSLDHLPARKQDELRAIVDILRAGAPVEMVRAQEIIVEERPTSATFAQLAVFAYQAGQTRKGDLAADKAVELAPKDERKQLKDDLEQAKRWAAGR